MESVDLLYPQSIEIAHTVIQASPAAPDEDACLKVLHIIPSTCLRIPAYLTPILIFYLTPFFYIIPTAGSKPSHLYSILSWLSSWATDQVRLILPVLDLSPHYLSASVWPRWIRPYYTVGLEFAVMVIFDVTHCRCMRCMWNHREDYSDL